MVPIILSLVSPGSLSDGPAFHRKTQCLCIPGRYVPERRLEEHISNTSRDTLIGIDLHFRRLFLASFHVASLRVCHPEPRRLCRSHLVSLYFLYFFAFSDRLLKFVGLLILMCSTNFESDTKPILRIFIFIPSFVSWTWMASLLNLST